MEGEKGGGRNEKEITQKSSSSTDVVLCGGRKNVSQYIIIVEITYCQLLWNHGVNLVLF